MKNESLINISENLEKTPWLSLILSNKKVNVYIVGGIVRDSFLNIQSKDIDLVIEGMDLPKIKDFFKNHNFGRIIENNVGDSFKVLKFKPHGWKGEPIDIATPRQDKKIGVGHKGFLALPAKSINDDLKRRDFTINSMAFDIRKKTLIDPFRGLRDLSLGLVKATNKKAFVEDPLRMIRAIQFSARFHFDIEKTTKDLIRENAHLIKEITGERILEEFKKIINKKGSTKIALDLMAETKLDEPLLDGFLDPDYSEDLDDLSFFYILSKTGKDSPMNFFMHRLRGDKNMGKELETLDKLLKDIKTEISEEDLRYLVFQSIKRSPRIGRCLILPERVDSILNMMNRGLIPSSMDDIPISGKDIENHLGIKGKMVGYILGEIIRKSLMNKINWKNHLELIKFASEF